MYATRRAVRVEGPISLFQVKVAVQVGLHLDTCFGTISFTFEHCDFWCCPLPAFVSEIEHGGALS